MFTRAYSGFDKLIQVAYSLSFIISILPR